MTTYKTPICNECKHFHFLDHAKMSCTAFPDGIPGIIFSKGDHNKPLKGQKNDIVFEKLKVKQ